MNDWGGSLRFLIEHPAGWMVHNSTKTKVKVHELRRMFSSLSQSEPNHGNVFADLQKIRLMRFLKPKPFVSLLFCRPILVFALLQVAVLASAQHHEGFIHQIERDFELQALLYRAERSLAAFERAEILHPFGQNESVEKDPECLMHYLAEEVSKSWIDSVMTVRAGGDWTDCPCRSAFLSASLYDEIKVNHPNVVQHIALEFKELARMHGVSVATVWFVTEFTQITAITVLTAYGLGQYALLAPFIPISFINTGIAIQLKSVKHNRRMRKGYGGREIKRTAEALEKEITKDLKQNYRNTVLVSFPHAHPDSLRLLAVQDPTWFSLTFRGGRLNPSRMYFRKARRYFRKTTDESHEVRDIFRDKELKKHTRTLFAIQRLHTEDSLAFEAFYAQFSQTFTTVGASDYYAAVGSTEAKAWVYEMLRKTYPEQLREGLRAVPSGLSVRVVLDLLESYIYPTWAREMKKSDFRMFRRMVKGTRAFRYESLLVQNHPWTHLHAQRLLDLSEIPADADY